MSSSAVVLPKNVPVGYRFSPTEEEVISHYMKLKNQGVNAMVDPVMATVDFCAFDPWELPPKSIIKSSDQVWWFFCPRDYKYNNSKRSNRRTKTGYWKITGKGQKIKSTKGVIGGKRILVFHKGPCPGQGTEWVMHEYHFEPENANPIQKSYVVCRLERKTDEKGPKTTSPDYETGQPSGESSPDGEYRLPSSAIPGFQLFCDTNNQVDLDSFFPHRNAQNAHDFLNGIQVSFSDDEAVDVNFANSLIVEPEEYQCGATTKRYSLDGADSSETDDERIRQAVGSHDNSKRVRHLQMNRTPSETLHTYSGGNVVEETIVSGQFSEEDTSSDDFTPGGGIKINPLDLGSVGIRQFTTGRNNVIHFNEGDVPIRGGVHHTRVQPPKKVSIVAVPGNKVPEAGKHSVTHICSPKKEKSTEESENLRKTAHCSSSVKRHFELQAGCESTVSSKLKSFFTFEETSSVLSCDTTPPSVYVLNTVVGVVLFLVFLRELVLFGSW
ncbi:NAC domain-containing protein 14-like [Humulus lupulus]|uniref:NAC domain-containing protein 14-like n=1 Tax=Humulus lupulus TaxID=3486 RepID=UPI002B41405F|nr:NAC domain-containing protein 14-like [Humulus lupulus]